MSWPGHLQLLVEMAYSSSLAYFETKKEISWLNLNQQGSDPNQTAHQPEHLPVAENGRSQTGILPAEKFEDRRPFLQN